VCVCVCVFSGIGLCDGPIPRPEESDRVSVYVLVCVLLDVTKRNNSPLLLELVGTKRSYKKQSQGGN
jgi:hypothetical protein